MSPPRHVFLVDGSGFIFRAYHALPPLTRSDGTPVGAVLGFSNMLLKLLQGTDADHIAVVFDTARATFRNRIYEAYKAHRAAAARRSDSRNSRWCARRRMRSTCAASERDDYEADDLIAAYAKNAVAAGADVTIVSSDKDLMQLVTDRVLLHDPIKERPIGAAEVQEKFGVAPDKVIDVQALCGDSVDNVPGVPGIGVKTAAELIGAYGDLENLLAHAAEIKQPKRRQSLIDFAEQARISKRLVTLDQDAPLPVPLEALAVKPLDREKLQRFLTENNFRTLLARVTRLGQEPAAPAAVARRQWRDPAVARAGARHEHNRAALRAGAGHRGARPLDRRRPRPGHGRDRHRDDLARLRAGRAGGRVAGIGAGRSVLHPARPPRARRRAAPGAAAARAAEAAIARLKPLLEDESVLKIGQNIKYDIAVLGALGVRIAPTDCTMLMSFVLDGAQHGHGLDELAKIHFGHDTISYKDVAGSGRDHLGFAAASLERARDYAAEDADYAFRLHQRLKPRLIAEHMLAFYETVERPLAAVVAGMESAGIEVDRVELSRLSQDFAVRLAALETEIHKLAGHPFNVGSPKQLGEVLFDELGLAGGRKGKTGAYGTDAGVLEQLGLTHDLPARVLDWRQLAKLKSTYADALVDQVNPRTGRVHTSYALASTSTGRIASTDPNLQNIPIRTEEGRKIRRAFVAAPGHVLISADYSQIELRLAAHVADVGPLKEAFRLGADIHALTASEVFGVPAAGIDPNLRRRAKAINFGIIYGISAFGLASQLGIAQSEASDYIKAYFQRFPGIRDYMERAKAEAREKGYVETLFGRRCYIPGIKDGNAARRAGAERQAINAPLQGAAADIIKRAMRRVPGALAAAGLAARMLLQVHDELVFEAPEVESQATAALVKRVMEGAPMPARELAVPLVVETGMARNWDDAH